MSDKNRDTIDYYGGSPADVRLSHWEYHDLIDQLLDDRLTAQGLMKFKRLHSHMAINAIVIPVITFPIALFASKWLAGMYLPTQDLSTEEWRLSDSTLSA